MNPKKPKELQARFSARARAKKQARTIARHAMLRGEIALQPCRVCGESDVEMHHPDYTRPLNVVFLCRFHHDELHRAVPRASKMCKDCGDEKEPHRIGSQSRCLKCQRAYMRRYRKEMVVYKGQVAA